MTKIANMIEMILKIYVFVLNKGENDIKIYDDICTSLSALFGEEYEEPVNEILKIIGKLTYSDSGETDEKNILKLILQLFIGKGKLGENNPKEEDFNNESSNQLEGLI